MMTGKDDWNEAYREIIARGRDAGGGPPTAEEIEAYSRGDLPEAEMARIRALLVHYPDVARALSEREPATPEGHLLSDAKLAADWDAIQRRMRKPVPVPAAAAALSMTPLRIWATAATVGGAIFAGLYIHSQSSIQDLREQLGTAVNMEKVVVAQEGNRGAPVVTALHLKPSTDTVLLVLTLVDESGTDRCRIDLLDAASTPNRVIRSLPDVSRRRDGTFAVQIPRNLLEDGDYLVRLYAGPNYDRLVAVYRIPRLLD